MNHVWISDGILSFMCFSSALSLWKHATVSAKLATLSLLLLSLASLLGTLRYALNIETPGWIFLHNQASRLFGVAGLYVLIYVWLDFSGLLRIQLPWSWAHMADGVLIFLVGYWLNQLENFQLVIGLLMNLAALIAGFRLINQQRLLAGLGLICLSALFVVNGLVVGGAQTPFIGPLLHIDAFHLVFALWAWGIHKVICEPEELNLIGKSFP